MGFVIDFAARPCQPGPILRFVVSSSVLGKIIGRVAALAGGVFRGASLAIVLNPGHRLALGIWK
jgi:hypothetical protein